MKMINDLSFQFHEENLFDIDQIAPQFRLSGRQELIIYKNLIEMVDEFLHDHLIGVGPLPSQELEKRGFIYSAGVTLGHNELGNWLLKGNTNREIDERCDHILRVPMAEKMRQVVKRFDLDIYVPQKRLVPSFFKEKRELPSDRYYVLAEKVVVDTPHEILTKILQMNRDQIVKIARQIVMLICLTGWMDIHASNLSLNSAGQLVILDTEPWGILSTKEMRPFASSSIEEGARNGLRYLFNDTLYWPMRISPKGGKTPLDHKLEEIIEIFEIETQKGHERFDFL